MIVFGLTTRRRLEHERRRRLLLLESHEYVIDELRKAEQLIAELGAEINTRSTEQLEPELETEQRNHDLEVIAEQLRACRLERAELRQHLEATIESATAVRNELELCAERKLELETLLEEQRGTIGGLRKLVRSEAEFLLGDDELYAALEEGEIA